ncbi:MAG: RluA family pseudouridine synthase [Bacteroides sp.]|nr:RluA family pseudouridine synthase [Bacteroides sp.]
MNAKVHFFPFPIASIALPAQFTYPFHYTPHTLTELAAKEVQIYLQSRKDWAEELQEGKMFGVLIVRTPEKRIGYLAAFSGNLAGSNHHSFFVPPVYDMLQPDGFFRQEEKNISAINLQIKKTENSSLYLDMKNELNAAKQYAAAAIAQYKEALKKAKSERDERRKSGISPEEETLLIRESQHQKASFKRKEKELQNFIKEKQDKVRQIEETICLLKQERKKRSAALQEKLFGQFRMLNAKGERKDLCELFKSTPQGFPPSGAGECALPKLLQYAYSSDLTPLAMGEFWWGMSPKDEIRHHGHFYPSCKGKCEPILRHMLIGLDIENNPLEDNIHQHTPLDILYEDDSLLVVNKPAGMLSVPGKNDLDSIFQRLRILYPHATGPIIVHRLDMDTSGLLLAAKTKEVHQKLQALFEERKIKKRYTALLEGELSFAHGTISLPLCLNPLDRPRQMVDFTHGKEAVTYYETMGYENGKTRVYFYPLTGRTHQLRVHAAHSQGLNHPIVGDELYGWKSDRLYLHAAELEFLHPVTQKIIHITKEADF